MVGNGLLVLDLVIQHAPGVLHDRPYLHFELKVRIGPVLGQLEPRVLELEIEMQTLVAERGLRVLDGRDLVGDFDHLELALENRADLLDVVLIEADDAQADQVTDVVPDLVRRRAGFQGLTVFEVEFLDALLAVLQPRLDLGEGHRAELREQVREEADQRPAGVLQHRRIGVVEDTELCLLALEVRTRHGSPLHCDRRLPTGDRLIDRLARAQRPCDTCTALSPETGALVLLPIIAPCAGRSRRQRRGLVQGNSAQLPAAAAASHAALAWQDLTRLP